MGFRYAFEDRPHWWPSTIEYSSKMCNSLDWRDLNVLHSMLIGSMREETTEALREMLEELLR